MPDERKPSEFPDEKPQVTTYDVIQEALRRQAERRGPLAPPKEVQMPPSLPKQPRPARDRKKRRR